MLLTLKKVLKIPEIYMIAILSSFHGIAPQLILANYKIYGQTFIDGIYYFLLFNFNFNKCIEFMKDDKFLTLIITICAVINIFTRFFWGIIFDKISFKVKFSFIIKVYKAKLIEFFLDGIFIFEYNCNGFNIDDRN